VSLAATAPVADHTSSRERDRVLDPIARTSEALFGLIMALTFTGTLGAAIAGRDEIRTLLVGMIGCNIAWGLVDAVMFLMTSLTERGRGLVMLRALHAAPTPQRAHRLIVDAVPPLVGSALTAGEIEDLRLRLMRTQDVPARASLSRKDWIGALAVFLIVVASTFPVVIPFLLFSHAQLALRVSNLVAIVMLFCLGYRLGQYSGHRPLRTGSSMVLLGVVLVGLAIALGG
jgi:VIT family protein